MCKQVADPVKLRGGLPPAQVRGLTAGGIALGTGPRANRDGVVVRGGSGFLLQKIEKLG